MQHVPWPWSTFAGFGQRSSHNLRIGIGTIDLGEILKAGPAAEGTPRSRWLWAAPEVGIQSGLYL